jgi:hypothetical protein
LFGTFLLIKNFGEFKKEIRILFENLHLKLLFLAGIVFILFGFLYFIFFYIGLFVFLSAILFLFGKVIEKVGMIKKINARDLREGDWLVNDVCVGKKIIKADWQGLERKDLKILHKLKRKIKVKEGIPFVPAFFIAFVLWIFRDRILAFVFHLI